MNFHFALMILGDFLVIVMMGFYAGVGIWESGTVGHVLGMLVPTMLVWLAASLIFKLYSGLPKTLGAVRFKALGPYVDMLIKAQKPGKTFFVWAITCAFQTFWLSFYWRGVIHSTSYFYRFSFGTLLWYVSSYAFFFLFWRILWTVFAVLIGLARSYTWLRGIGIALQVLILLYAIAILAINLHYAPRKFKVETVPEGAPRTALVFGAGIYLNGQPSAVLVDRVNTAIELYQRGLIDEMIMSGDNSDRSRNEVDHMVRMALEAGVPESAILRDDYGIHTAESVYNAKNVFGKDAVIFVSQDFHNVRILMTGEKYGLDGIAVAADRRIYNVTSWITWYLLDWLRLPVYWIHY
ncbi:MAG: YdcF family protein [Flexilinea sp.]|nr:YdcF family protein [Flexilinea sp.]